MSSERWIKQHWRIITAFVLFVLLAPVAPPFALLFVTLPLAALLATTPPRLARETVVAAVAGGFSFAWLLQLGELPDQFLRAGALLAAAVFVPATWYTRSSLAHRVVLAAGLAVVGVGGGWLALGGSWWELHWWVEYRIGFLVRLVSAAAWGQGWVGTADVGNIVDLFTAYVRFTSDYFVALVALQLMAGLALAASIYQHLVQEPRGEPLGRWSDFRFTEHLGWAAVVSLVIVLIPKLAAAQLGALNLLLVVGTLFALRGAAVATAGLKPVGTGGRLLLILAFMSAFLVLRGAVVGAILLGALSLGIVDTGFDLRRRWQTPPAG